MFVVLPGYELDIYFSLPRFYHVYVTNGRDSFRLIEFSFTPADLWTFQRLLLHFCLHSITYTVEQLDCSLPNMDRKIGR